MQTRNAVVKYKAANKRSYLISDVGVIRQIDLTFDWSPVPRLD